MTRCRHKSPLTGVRRDDAIQLLVYAVWFAAVASLGEMAHLTYSKEVTKARVIGFEYMWRIPLGYAFVFSVIAFACWVVARRQRRAMPAFLVASFFVIACGWLPNILRGVHGWAILLLAAGAAVQLTRIAGKHPHPLQWLVRRTVAPALLLIVALSTGFYGWPLINERRELSRLPPASGRGPNVILIVLDTVRAKSLSLYGYQRSTSPNLDRFASRGAVFNRAYSTAPWTLPSHGSMFTARLPHELSTTTYTPLDATHPTLAEGLSRHGFLTAGFVANTRVGGAAYGLSRGFLRYEDEPTTVMTSFINTSFGRVVMAASSVGGQFATHHNFGRKNAEDVNRGFLAWLSGRKTDRPFFAFLNYFDAHSPYLPPGDFAFKFSKTRPRGDLEARRADAWSAAEIQEMEDAYDGSIAYLDDQLGRLFDALDKQSVMKDTIVIVTSDHGEHFGEHNLLGHETSLYPALLHVPLVIVYEGHVPAGGRVDEMVSLRNLPATVIELTGVRDPFGFPGKPLLLRGPTAEQLIEDGEVVLAEVERITDDSVPEWYPTRRGRMKSVLFDGWQYIKNYGDGSEELFDLYNDPETAHNLANVEVDRLQNYRRYLESVLAQPERERIRADKTDKR